MNTFIGNGERFLIAPCSIMKNNVHSKGMTGTSTMEDSPLLMGEDRDGKMTELLSMAHQVHPCLATCISRLTVDMQRLEVASRKLAHHADNSLAVLLQRIMDELKGLPDAISGILIRAQSDWRKMIETKIENKRQVLLRIQENMNRTRTDLERALNENVNEQMEVNRGPLGKLRSTGKDEKNKWRERQEAMSLQEKMRRRIQRWEGQELAVQEEMEQLCEALEMGPDSVFVDKYYEAFTREFEITVTNVLRQWSECPPIEENTHLEAKQEQVQTTRYYSRRKFLTAAGMGVAAAAGIMGIGKNVLNPEVSTKGVVRAPNSIDTMGVDEIMTHFPDTIPGIASVEKYPVQDAKKCIVIFNTVLLPTTAREIIAESMGPDLQKIPPEEQENLLLRILYSTERVCDAHCQDIENGLSYLCEKKWAKNVHVQGLNQHKINELVDRLPELQNLDLEDVIPELRHDKKVQEAADKLLQVLKERKGRLILISDKDKISNHPWNRMIGGALRLVVDEKITLQSTTNATPIAFDWDLQRDGVVKKMLVARRGEVFHQGFSDVAQEVLNIFSKEKNHLITAILAAAVDWKGEVDKWNTHHPGQKYSTIKLTPIAQNP